MELTKDKQEEKIETPDEEKGHSAKHSPGNYPGKEVIALCGIRFKLKGTHSYSIEENIANGTTCQDCLMVVASICGRSL